MHHIITESVPALGWPHVTTDLSARMAANAPPSFCRVDLFHMPEFIFDGRAVTPMIWRAPCHDEFVFQDGGKGTVC